MAKYAQRLATNANLHVVGCRHGIDVYAFKTGRKRVANMMEAILGAAYFDGGSQAAETIMTKLGLV